MAKVSKDVANAIEEKLESSGKTSDDVTLQELFELGLNYEEKKPAKPKDRGKTKLQEQLKKPTTNTIDAKVGAKRTTCFFCGGKGHIV